MITAILAVISWGKTFKNQKLYGRLLMASVALDTILTINLIKWLL